MIKYESKNFDSKIWNLENLAKEHDKNINLIDKRISCFSHKLQEFFKDKPVKQIYHLPNQPNIAHYITHDNRYFIVEFSLDFPSTEKLTIKEQPISCLPFSLPA